MCGTVIYTTMWWLNRNFNGMMGERWPILGNCDIVAIVWEWGLFIYVGICMGGNEWRNDGSTSYGPTLIRKSITLNCANAVKYAHIKPLGLMVF